jgi:hypothetical protein
MIIWFHINSSRSNLASIKSAVSNPSQLNAGIRQAFPGLKNL